MPLPSRRRSRAEPVDLELVFAADGSGSIDDDELRLQRKGWADALTSKDVLDGIRDGAVGAIAVAYMEWGGPQSQVLIVDWHVIRDEASARVFADKLIGGAARRVRLQLDFERDRFLACGSSRAMRTRARAR